MSKILAWAKSNPIILVSAVLALAAIVGLVVVHRMGRGLSDAMQAKSAVIGQVVQLQKTPVTLPSQAPDQPPEQRQIIVNDAAVRQLEQLSAEMHQQFEGINNIIRTKNQRSHQPMVPGLLPEPAGGAQRITIKHEFRRQLFQLLLKPPAERPFSALNAGNPPMPQEIQLALETATREFLTVQTFPPKPLEQLSPAERERLAAAQKDRLLDVLRDRAQAIHIYAAVPPSLQALTQIPNFPFPLDDSAIRRPETPEQATIEEIWEGQMSLWIQQDIVEAIARANRVDDPHMSVIDVPIKRLLKISVMPGCVGVGANQGGFRWTPPTGPSPVPVNPWVSPTGAPPGTPLVQPPTDPSAKIASDFTYTPTGRVTNSIFDVRHVWLKVVVDSQRLPELYEALAQVNFMTVLAVRFVDVDEYLALQEGFVYGDGDAVQADILIETIWFRDWTTKFMPRTIKEKLGLAPPAVAGALPVTQ